MANRTLIDPLGRNITLRDTTWYGHILKRHPILGGTRALVEVAVEGPLEIHFSSSDSACRIYYGTGQRPGKLIAVVADVVEGFVKTAYQADKMKGALEWSP